MDIFGVIAAGILGFICSMALSIFAGIIATVIVVARRIRRKRQGEYIPMQAKPEPLPYTVNYSKVEDQHGNAHESVVIQYKPESEVVKHEPVKEIPVNEPHEPPKIPETPVFKPTKRTAQSESKGNVMYLFALNKLKRQIRALKNDTEREKAEIERLLRCMRQYRNRMSGEQYEVYCAIMLTHIGYTNIILTPQTGDFGADIIAMKDGCRYCFQCKCYSLPVGVHAVQEIHSALTYYNCDIAGVITNSTFTPSAMELADKLNVMMIDDF